MKIYVLGISGSPRHGNTELLVKEALKAAEELGDVETKLISLADYELKPCESCHLCFGFMKGATEETVCYKHRDVDPIIKEMLKADGLIIGSPVYTWDMSGKLRCLLEKCAALCPAAFSELSYRFRFKVVGAIAVSGGLFEAQESVVQAIWRWAIPLGMIPVGAVYTVEDPFPGSSLLGGIASEAFSKSLHDSDSITKEKSGFLWTPFLKSTRSLGRNVATISRIVKVGVETLKKTGVKIPESKAWVKYPKKPQPGSYIEKLVKEGKVKVVER